LRKEGGNPIIGKTFWFIVSKNRKFRIYRREPVLNNSPIRNSNDERIESLDNSRYLINNMNLNEETSLFVGNENN